MKNVQLSIVAFVLAVCSANSAPLTPFRDGETVVFLGDSITHAGRYVADLQLIWSLRHPGSNVRFHNAGINGNRAGSGMNRYDWDVAALKPDRVFILFGMNDVARDDRWAPPDAAGKAKRRAELTRTFVTNLTALVRKVKCSGAVPVVMTPTPFDQYAAIPNVANCPGTDDPGLKSFAERAREIATAEGVELVDLHAALLSILKAHPEKRFLGDRVHPDHAGHLLIAEQILRAMGETNAVGEVSFDASKGARNFAYMPTRLPYPTCGEYAIADSVQPLSEEWNRETVRISGLPSGNWVLRLGGTSYGTFSAEELSAGINVTTADEKRFSPSLRKSAEVWKTMSDFHTEQSEYRVLAQTFVQVRRLGGDVGRLDSCLEKYQEWIEGFRKCPETLQYYTLYGNMIPMFKAKYLAKDECWCRIERLRDEIASVRPEAYEISVARADEDRMPQAVWVASPCPEDVSVSFRTEFEWDGIEDVKLIVAASAVYRAFLNGQFAAWGPARAVHGHSRVDKWPLAVRKGRNVLTIEVAGYRFESFQYCGGEPFLAASVEAGCRRISSTPTDFKAVEVPRARKGPKYSYQRGFVAEEYDVGTDWKSWNAGETTTNALLQLVNVPVPTWLERAVPYPDFSVNRNFRWIKDGKGRDIMCLGGVDSGFVGLEIECLKPGRIVFEFDEALGTNGVIDLKRNGDPLVSWHAMYNRLTWNVRDSGIFHVETIEPYTLKYAQVKVESGEFASVHPYLRRCRNALVGNSSFKCGDERLNRLFAAAKESLAQNSVDIFTDCPSRERVGWLCDTYFSSEAAAWLTGDFSIEREYLLNFARTDDFGKNVPQGAIPGFMPSRSGGIMPTYMMWYVIQVCVAAERLGPRERAEFLKCVGLRMEGVVRWISGYERNELLEDLPGWVFIEWSRANSYVKGVNFPANMLWALALERSGRLLGRDDWIEKAAVVRAKVKSLSYDGQVFHDQALRDKNGALVVNGDSKTETCQYYAFFTGLAKPTEYPALWRMVVDELGPDRKGHPEIEKSDVFFGWLLRLELLSKHRETDRMISDMKAYYGEMADASGTFWEFADGHDSRCHAIGSYVAVLLLREAMGIERVDWAEKTVYVCRPGISGAKCVFPVTEGLVSLTGDALCVPNGWKVVDSIRRIEKR